MDIQERIMQALKNAQEVTALGFSRKELEAAASLIEGGLTLSETDTDEETTAKVDAAVKAQLPMFRFIQSVSDRKQQQSRAQERKQQQQQQEAQTPPTGGHEPQTAAPKAEPQQQQQQGISPEIKALTDMVKRLTDEVGSLRQEKVADTRRERFARTLAESGIAADTGAYQRRMRGFSRMRFADDDDFTQFLDEEAEGIKAEAQEIANGRLAAAQQPKQPKQEAAGKPKVMSDAEIDEMAKMF